MTETIRLPLVEDLEPRLADSNKDGLSSNIFYDKNKSGNTYAVKRPGISSYVSAQGVGLGIFLGYGWTIPYAVWPKIIWANNQFITPCQEFYPTGWSNLVIFSEDGIKWTQSTMPENAYWEGIAWNGSVYCACSAYTETTDAGSIATSPTGVTWTDRTVPDGKWRDIEAGGSQLVAIGQGSQVGFVNSVYSSDNGVTWTAGNLDSSGWRECAWNAAAGLFCAVGSSTTTRVATSPTGAVWTNRTIPAGGRSTIASNGTLWFTPTDGSAIGHTSTDGVTWTQVTLPASRTWLDVSWTGTQFVLTALLSNVLTVSANGSTWTEVTMPTLISNEVDISGYSAVAGNTDTTVILGDGPYYYSYSTDDNATFTMNNLNAYSALPTITP
jgi:hypothetical protein